MIPDFFFRYITNGTSCLKSDKNVLKENYEDLRNSLDLVGFTDEVSMLKYAYRINIQKDMSFKSHLHVSERYLPLLKMIYIVEFTNNSK